MNKIAQIFTKPILKKITLILSSVAILFTAIIYFLPFTKDFHRASIWTFSESKSVSIAIMAVFFIFAFFINFSLYVILFLKLWKNQIKSILLFSIHASFNIVIIFLLFLLNSLFHFYSYSLWLFLILQIILNGIIIIAQIMYIKAEEQRYYNLESLNENNKAFPGWSLLITDVLSMIALLLVIFIPIFSLEGQKYIVLAFLSNNGLILMEYAIGACVFVLFFGSILFFIFLLAAYFSNIVKYYKMTKIFHKINLVFTGMFFGAGLFFEFYYRIAHYEANTVAYIPFVFVTVIYLIHAFFCGKTAVLDSDNLKLISQKERKFKFVPLIFVVLFTMITFSSLFFTLINIEINVLDIYVDHTKFTGLQLLKSYSSLNEVFQSLAFAYVIILTVSGVLLLVSLTYFLTKSLDFKHVIKVSIYSNLFFTFLLAMAGVYFVLNKKSTEIHIKLLLEYLPISVPNEYIYNVKTQNYVIFLISLVVLIMYIISFPSNKFDTQQLQAETTTLEVMDEVALPKEPVQEAEDKIDEELSLIPEDKITENVPLKEFLEENLDPCPAFSELDSKKEIYNEELEIKKEFLFKKPTLSLLVDFIVSYAANSRLHLSYSHEDIATFVAGLGTSRLAILQGMSGTGKTSLPKIFLEAIMGTCEIIEVESSWRDKNELLGYYNEFSKTYTPKKFTQSLYKAKLSPDVPTFIVLDEMNLSRIEYYFSDFLSLMEAEEHKREIKLLNLKLYNRINGECIAYSGLTNGHTLKIPTNVWFIGTANRDESTFEISDKVYDRAQTMNFYKRAPKVRFFQESLKPKFIPYSVLAELFEEGKHYMEYDAEEDEIIKEVEKILAPFNISFGNRILNHIDHFVKIYCACFADSKKDQVEVAKTAVETILLSKVVSKVEFKQIDNREKLACAFDKLQLFKCSAFIRRLSED